jgi:hypothetical protein
MITFIDKDWSNAYVTADMLSPLAVFANGATETYSKKVAGISPFVFNRSK